MASPDSSALTGNRLLDALPGKLRAELHPHMEGVSLRVGNVIHEPGERFEHLYFPTTSIVSILYTLEEGATTETALIGYEGATGIARILGSSTTPTETVVSMSGAACRIRARTLMEKFQQDERLRAILLRYVQALITQISQTAVCNRLHPVDARLCRWLLLARDRVQAEDIRMTHELVAHMLGVRRECVTHAVRRLQNAGLVHNGRGRITILDPEGLETASCECYNVVRTEFDRLLGEERVSGTESRHAHQRSGSPSGSSGDSSRRRILAGGADPSLS